MCEPYAVVLYNNKKLVLPIKWIKNFDEDPEKSYMCYSSAEPNDDPDFTLRSDSGRLPSVFQARFIQVFGRQLKLSL